MFTITTITTDREVGGSAARAGSGERAAIGSGSGDVLHADDDERHNGFACGCDMLMLFMMHVHHRGVSELSCTNVPLFIQAAASLSFRSYLVKHLEAAQVLAWRRGAHGVMPWSRPPVCRARIFEFGLLFTAVAADVL